MNRFPPNLGSGCFHHAPPIHGIQNTEIQKKFFVTSSLLYSMEYPLLPSLHHWTVADAHPHLPYRCLYPHPLFLCLYQWRVPATSLLLCLKLPLHLTTGAHSQSALEGQVERKQQCFVNVIISIFLF